MAEAPIPFQIKSIATRQFATMESAYKEGDEAEFTSTFNFGVGKEDHLVVTLLDVSFSFNGSPFIILKIKMDFDVQPEAFDRFKSKDGAIIVPKAFLTHLAAMSISTARGILHAELKDSEFNHVVLPVLNVSEVLQEDVRFE
jgi:hypothetical protein